MNQQNGLPEEKSTISIENRMPFERRVAAIRHRRRSSLSDLLLVESRMSRQSELALYGFVGG